MNSVPAAQFTSARQANRLLEQQDLYELARSVLDELLVQTDLDELIRTTPVVEGGEIVDHIHAHELRCAVVRFSELGLVGKVDLAVAMVHIRVAIEDKRRAIAEEQPGCSWKLVAALVEQVDTRTSVAQSSYTPGPRHAMLTAADLENPEEETQPRGLGIGTRHVEVTDYRCAVYMVWADPGRGVLVDPAASHAQTADGRASGPMQKYRTTRRYGDLSPNGRDNRDKAVAWVQEFQSRQAESVASPVIDFQNVQKSAPGTTDPFAERVLAAAARGRPAQSIARELGVPPGRVVDVLVANGRLAAEPIQAPEPKPRKPRKPRKPSPSAPENDDGPAAA